MLDKLIFVFIPFFFGVVLGKMERRKNFVKSVCGGGGRGGGVGKGRWPQREEGFVYRGGLKPSTHLVGNLVKNRWQINKRKLHIYL